MDSSLSRRASDDGRDAHPSLGGRFRQLNEDLYTSTGAANAARFAADPELAVAYHRGFREQARSWPENPLDAIISRIKALPGGRVVADFGCGDARLAVDIRRVSMEPLRPLWTVRFAS